MTPVEATITSFAWQPKACPANIPISSASANPGSPVQALAQPALATMARAVPL